MSWAQTADEIYKLIFRAIFDPRGSDWIRGERIL